jgi:hypothetical protein
MKIQIISNEGEVLREYPYGFRPVERNSNVPDRRREGGSHRGGITRNATYGNKPALLIREPARSGEHKAIGPVKSLLAQRHNNIIFVDKEIDLKDASSDEGLFFSLNINTEALKDRYAIGRVNLYEADQRINKYREAQAYRSLQKPILEIFI